jgi:hypothetical protein
MEATRVRSAAFTWNVGRRVLIVPPCGWREGVSRDGCNREGSSTDAGPAGGPARSSAEAPVMGVERRGRVIRGCVRSINRAESSGGVAWTS